MYDPELLRTFLAVADALSFTRAAQHLGLRQPTVSHHVRKLEEAVGRPLFVRDTRTVRLTADGETLAGFARAILAAHDQAETYFTGSGLQGRLRFGVTDDLALSPLPRILREFRRLYPRVDLELTVTQNEALLRRIESGHLDVAFVKRNIGEPTSGNAQVVRRDRLIWASGEPTRLHLGERIPLVVYQAPSLSRSVAVQAIERAGHPYRITCTVRGVNGVLAAVRAGLGVAVMARSLVPDDLYEMPEEAGLPELGELELVLLTGPRPSEAASVLTTAILRSRTPLAPAR